MIYIATLILTDRALETSVLAKHVENLSMKHEKAALKVVKYLRGTSAYTLKLDLGESKHLSGHVDANWSSE